jgi:hypothetical protein
MWRVNFPQLNEGGFLPLLLLIYEGIPGNTHWTL